MQQKHMLLTLQYQVPLVHQYWSMYKEVRMSIFCVNTLGAIRGRSVVSCQHYMVVWKWNVGM